MNAVQRSTYERLYDAAARLDISTGSLLMRLHNFRRDGLMPPIVDPSNAADWLVRRRDVDVIEARTNDRAERG